MNPPGTATPVPAPAGSALSDGMMRVIGSTGSTPELLALLLSHQHARRLLTLRALLEAVATAPAGTLPRGTAARVLGDWRLLEAADRADPAATRQVVQYPHTGAWAERCLRALTRPGQAHRAAEELPHLAALSVAAAARAGLRFTADVPLRDGELRLPTLGGLRPPGTGPDPGAPAGPAADGGPAPLVRVVGEPRRLWLLPAPPDGAFGDAPTSPPPGRGPAPAAGTVEVRQGQDGIWRSASPGWRQLQALRHPDGRAVLIDDVDPYRDEERRTNPYGLDIADRLDAAGHAAWRTAWHDARPWLRLSGSTRAEEVGALLDCVVPLYGAPGAQCSATRGEAFGALLSSTPRDGLELAATLVHELQHAKLLAVSRLAVLHTADDSPGYWAPWRPDPRPFDGLFQGAYAHLALADFHLRAATVLTDPVRRDAAWADHCRCREQVGAALPQLLGARALTRQGRALANAMAAHHTRLKEHAPPDGHLARATAYVETARVIWRRRLAQRVTNGAEPA
ncbi:HEXXH motif-containing protein [Actinacidiphila yanglinensis]|uniref:HEXXH motif-containing protein n=1 Tax=Actinacidiphila yanglinensis TaxID=310779 RepID=A0A1H5VI36_9ACTN|nr:HEXXH motif-containing putative peptide modification protein [Actinacidiphila yanglinensis]SEF86883.1 HEXXH motif-containing protein [Actinacidiphila yanglinensis]